MSINLLYVPLFTIEEVILDKDTGLPLAGGVVSFYRDSQRATPKSVFQIAGTSPNYTFTDVGSVLTLGISGTFVDGSGDPFVPYAYPYDADGNVDLYYVTVESAGSVDQFTREAVPYLAGTNIPSNQRSSTENELSNTQFVEILFPTSGSTILNVTGSNTVTPIAPNWDIVSSGTGTLTLQRLEPTASAIDTNPAYALSIAASAALGSEVTLRQRLNNTPSIMRGGFASGSLTVAVLSGGGSNISMTYAPSTGTSTAVIPSTSIVADGSYHVIANNAAIPQQVNDPASTGYIDINITIPTSRTIAISSIQLVGTEVAVDIPYDEQTTERQKDHLFHYYEDGLIFKPTPSYLVGWDFPLNPAQIFGNGGTVAAQAVGANKSYYAWDQSIVFQTNDSGITTTRNKNEYGICFTPTVNGQVALIQYLDGRQVGNILREQISVNIKANCALGTTLKCTVSLWYTKGSALPNIADGTNNSIVATLDANGKPATFNNPTGGTWIEVPKTSAQDAVFTLGPDVIDYGFNIWNLNNLTEARDATFFAIVIGTASMDSITAPSPQFISVGMCSGSIPTIPAAQTPDEVLRECQYYYEKSYSPDTVAGSATQLGVNQAITVPPVSVGGGVEQMHVSSFYLRYKQTKRNSGALVLYSPGDAAASLFSGGTAVVSPASGQVLCGLNQNGGYIQPAVYGTNPRNVVSTSWAGSGNASVDGVYLVCLITSTSVFQTQNAVSLAGDEGFMRFHYTVDSRLGIN